MTTGRSNSNSKFRWLTAAQAADFARISPNTLTAWARQGRLHPKQEMRKLNNGQTRVVAVFSEEELINKFHLRRGQLGPGEIAALAFEEFTRGTSVAEVVVKLRQVPQEIVELHEQWLRCGGSELVITKEAQLEFARLLGPFDIGPGVADILERVAVLVGRVAANPDSATAPMANPDSATAPVANPDSATAAAANPDSATAPANPDSATAMVGATSDGAAP